MTVATKTGEVKFLQQGKRGMLPYPAGEYDLHTSYICTDMLAPYVLHNGIYYVMNKITTWVGQGMPSNINNPQKDYAVNGTKATWIPFENYKAIYVELLMANFAKLASAVFYGDYMFSQHGINPQDKSVVDNYREFDPAHIYDGTFTPYILFNFITGDGHLAAGGFKFSSTDGFIISSKGSSSELRMHAGSLELIDDIFGTGIRSFVLDTGFLRGNDGIYSLYTKLKMSPPGYDSRLESGTLYKDENGFIKVKT